MYQSKAELSAAYARLYRQEILPCIEKGLAACVYTQVSDVEEEINGIFTYDREELKLSEKMLLNINAMLCSPQPQKEQH